jgi:hypothetical protein
MKLKHAKLVALQYLLFILILGACNTRPIVAAQPKPTESQQAADECISPIYNTFSYPVSGYDEKLPFPGKNFDVPPPSPWHDEALLPEIGKLNLGEYWEQPIVDIIQTRRIKDYTEIWVRIPVRGAEQQDYVAVYRTDTQDWEIIPEQIQTLIVGKDGSLWGTRYYNYTDTLNESINNGVLFKFDEKERIFSPVKDVQHLPPRVQEDGIDYYSKVLLDTEGIFWIVVPNDAIYSYDPAVGKVKRWIDFPHVFTDAKIAPNGSIYIYINTYTYQSGTAYSTRILKQFNPKTGVMDTTDLNYVLESSPGVGNILTDHLGRVWLDNVAYQDENGEWYQIQRSPLFISHLSESYNDYKYKNAMIILESSDGRIWFLHRDNGMISLDPQKGEWCWFTTYKSNIVEDSENNLWMIADGKLYKNALGK